MVGVDRSTVAKWEEVPDSESNVKSHNPFVSDYRVSISKDKYEPIYKRAKKGKSCAAIAADYIVTRRRATRRAIGKPSHALRLREAA